MIEQYERTGIHVHEEYSRIDSFSKEREKCGGYAEKGKAYVKAGALSRRIARFPMYYIFLSNGTGSA